MKKMISLWAENDRISLNEILNSNRKGCGVFETLVIEAELSYTLFSYIPKIVFHT